MAVQAILERGILVVHLHGEIDHHAVETIRDEIEGKLQETRYKGLIMSFRNIEFMDSSGLGLILGRYRSVSQHGGRMAICEVGGTLKRIFEMSGLLKVLPLFDTEEAAMEAVKGA